MHILLIDDHTLFREALLHVLKQLEAYVVVLESANAEEAAHLITHTRNLDLILLDIDLPGMDGLTALPHLRELAPTVPIILLSGSESLQHMKMALDGGAMGYIPKSCSSHEMLTALRIVLQGDVFVPPRLLSKLANPVLQTAESSSDASASSLLTLRQIDVLQLMAQGLPNKSIAKSLNLAEGTVKLHVAAILRILGASNRTQAVSEAVKLDLLRSDG